MKPTDRIRPLPPSGPRAGGSWLLWTLLLAALGTAGWFGFRPGGWFVEAEVESVRGALVRRGPLRISVLEKGNLKAADAVSLKNEIEGRTQILWLVPEGTYVEEGDLVCELDVTQLIDRRLSEGINVSNAEAAFVKSKQNYEIQVSQNESDVAGAEQKLTFAREDLVKFRDGDRPFDINKAKESIVLATEEAARAGDKLEWSEKLAEKGFLTATELEADKLSANRAEILLQQAKRELELLENFELPRREAELVAALEEAERELLRVKLQATAKLVDFEAALRTSEARLELQKEQLAKIETQIERAKLIAPRAGMVVYAQEEGGRWGNREPIQAGTEVRERQEIITIPRAGGMIAQASLHESVLKQVQPGQGVLIKIDAIPGRDFTGRVESVAVLPDQGSWWANPNMRVYRTEISIIDPTEEMRPGMSCSVEVLVEELEDAIYVPVQAVFRHGAGNVAFLVDGPDFELRDVEIGRHNDKWVQILSGLTEGDEVLLAPPADFTLEPGEDQPSDVEVPEYEAPAGAAGGGGEAGARKRPEGGGRPAGGGRPEGASRGGGRPALGAGGGDRAARSSTSSPVSKGQ